MIQRYFGFLMFFNFLFLASVEANMCIDLFSGPKIVDMEEYSRRRFVPTVGQMSSTSSIVAAWKKREGNAVFPLKNIIRWNMAVHKSIYLSPNQTIAISKGTDEKIRLYDAKSGKLLNTILLEEILIKQSADFFEIVKVEENHFVLGFESLWHRERNEKLGMRMFRPQSLMLLDFNGQILATYHSDTVIKGSVYLPEQKVWIAADQGTLEIIKIPPAKEVGNIGTLTGFLYESFNSGHFISTITIAPGGDVLYVGMSKIRHGQAHSEIFAINIKDVYHPKFLSKREIPISQVYKIEVLSDNSLRVVGSEREAQPTDPVKVWVLQ